MAKKIWNAEEKLQFERALQAKGCRYIAGVDEVGRGPLAGPVVCAAVIMPLEDADLIIGVDDSKKLSAKKREQLAEMIKEKAYAKINLYLEVLERLPNGYHNIDSVMQTVSLCDGITIECKKCLRKYHSCIDICGYDWKVYKK